MKLFLLMILLGSAILPVSAQQLQFNAPDPLPHGSFGDIHSSPGTLGDHYYLLYKQMARKIKGAEDPGDAYLKIYSVSEGTLLRSVNLDSLASTAHPGEAVLFTDLFIWRGKFVGIYASWKPAGTWVNLYAEGFDAEGNPEGYPLLLATAYPRVHLKTGDEKVASLDTRSILRLTGDLRHAFNGDSSRIALYDTGNDWTGIPVLVLSRGLTSVGKLPIDLPQAGHIISAIPEGADSLFALVSRPTPEGGGQSGFTLFTYTQHHALSDSIHITLSGKLIQDAAFHVEKDARLVVTGTYAPAGKPVGDKATYGVFALNMTPAGTLLHSDIRPFQGAMISDLEGYRAAKKDKGLQGVIRLSGLIPLPGTGMVSVGRSNYQRSEVTASPMILTPHYDAGGKIVLTKVSPSGEIRWISYLKRFYEDYPSTTMPTPFYATRDPQNHLVVIYDENGEQRTRQQIFVDRYDDQGIRDRDWMALPRSFNTRSTWILWNTATETNDDQIMVAYYNTWKKELGTLKIRLSNGMRVSSNP